ncbi:hypothetical protein EJ08DRAFT_737451 [Tothia fuscella]|uniref:DUF7730 domain-containing protein n=1 Tax=Tothia fuscella TaxID=1048955 RepID=A0A9P4NIS4_9PEZI|nr:hypothetical protein EJ08DRAFT_737451 [Tothia fuscella]
MANRDSSSKKRKASAEDEIAGTSSREGSKRIARPFNLNKGSHEMMTIASQNDTNVPFFKLPRELRDEIYHLALTGHVFELCYDERNKRATCSAESKSIASVAHLPRTCRRLYGETSALVYSKNVFKFPDIGLFTQFVEALLPAHQPQVRSIELEVVLLELSNLPPWRMPGHVMVEGPLDSRFPTIKISTAKALIGLCKMILVVRLELSMLEFVMVHFCLEGFKLLVHRFMNESLLALQRCPWVDISISASQDIPYDATTANFNVPLFSFKWRWLQRVLPKLTEKVKTDLLKTWDEEVYQNAQVAKRAKVISAKKAQVEKDRGEPECAATVKKLEAEVQKSEAWESKLKASRERKKAADDRKRIAEETKQQLAAEKAKTAVTKVVCGKKEQAKMA